jgi:superfamily II DNA/RNA helicase
MNILENLSQDEAAFKTCLNGPQALILTPTRELAIQIKDHLQTCCKYQKTKVNYCVFTLF